MTARLLLNHYVVLILLSSSISSALMKTASGDQPEIRRLLNAWREYEGIEVKGIVCTIRDGKTINEKSFVICRGTSANERVLRPKSVATLVPNPGEPHLKNDMIIDFFHAANNGVGLRFGRQFVSAEPPGWKMSHVIVGPGNFATAISGDGAYLSCLDELIEPFFGSCCGNADGIFGVSQNVKENWRFSIGEEDEYLGFKGKVIESYYKPSEVDASRAITFRTLVAFEPSVRVLKCFDATCPTPAVVRYINEQREAFRIKKLEVFSGLLIPTILELGSDAYFVRIEVKDVNRLPTDFHGLWDFDGPTGTRWFGDLLPTIRKSGVHQKPELGAGLEIPFTEEEVEAIRLYLVSKNTPVIRQGVQWTSVFFYVSSLFVLICVSLLIYRNVRGAT